MLALSPSLKLAVLGSLKRRSEPSGQRRPNDPRTTVPVLEFVAIIFFIGQPTRNREARTETARCGFLSSLQAFYASKPWALTALIKSGRLASNTGDSRTGSLSRGKHK